MKIRFSNDRFGINNYESTIYKTIFLMAVIKNMSTDISNDRFGIMNIS